MQQFHRNLLVKLMSQSQEVKESQFKEFIETLFPLYRSICSPGLDEALLALQKKFISDLNIERYPTSTAAWTWTLPQKWDLKDAYIESEGKRLINVQEEPLCVWGGSLPVDKTVKYEELMAHVYTDPLSPELIRWYFKYY